MAGTYMPTKEPSPCLVHRTRYDMPMGKYVLLSSLACQLVIAVNAVQQKSKGHLMKCDVGTRTGGVAQPTFTRIRAAWLLYVHLSVLKVMALESFLKMHHRTRRSLSHGAAAQAMVAADDSSC